MRRVGIFLLTFVIALFLLAQMTTEEKTQKGRGEQAVSAFFIATIIALGVALL